LIQKQEVTRTGPQAYFFDAFMRTYSVSIDETLARIHGQITQAVERLRRLATDRTSAATLISALSIWSGYRRPMQVIEAARGLDDPESVVLFDLVKHLTVEMANDHREYDLSLSIAKSLLTCFIHVPNCKKAFESQLATLQGNASSKRLDDICSKAATEYRQFISDVQKGGLGENARGLARELLIIFHDCVEKSECDPAPVFLIVRHLAVQLNNERGQGAVAVTLLKWLLACDPPYEVASRFKEDLKGLTSGSKPQKSGNGLGWVAAGVLLGALGS
jgi:hypothetical protein